MYPRYAGHGGWKNRLYSLAYHSRSIDVFRYVSNRFQIRSRPRFPFPIVGRRRDRNIQILFYHRVTDAYDPFLPGIPTGAFENQMAHLATRYRVMALDEAVERLTEDAIPDNAVVVTFDDGYKDNYRNAYPILTRYSIPATVFLATGAVDEGKPLWHDLVFSAFSETTVSCLDGFGHIGGRTSWSSPEEKWNAMETVLSYLKEQGNEQREAWIGMLRDKLGIAGPSGADDLMMSWAEIAEMHRGGISFGAHTVNHPVLTRVPIEQAISEIVTSKKVIEERIGASVTSFAYPNGKEGDYNESIKTILKDAGFTCAVTTISGANQKGQDVYELRRGTPWEQDLPAFAVKMAWQKYCSWE